MTDYRNDNIDPEEYWIGAEKLLDQHFQKRKRRRVMIIFFLFVLLGGWIGSQFYTYDPTIATKEIDAPVKSEIVQQENKIVNSKEQIIDNSKDGKVDIQKVSLANNEFKALSIKEEQLTVSKKKIRLEPTKKTAQISSIETNVNLENEDASDEMHNEGHEVAIAESALTISTQIDSSNLLVPNVDVVDKMNMINFSVSNSENIYGPLLNESLNPIKKRNRVDFMIYGGVANVSNTISGSGTTSYIDRINREEEDVILPHAGFQFSFGKGSLELRAGAELSFVGEEVNYSPYANGDYYQQQGKWEPYQYTFSDSDSTFIFGNLYISTTLVTINDSAYVIKTDTLNGVYYDESIASENGINKQTYIELPFELAYTHQRNRFGFGLSAGLSPAILIDAQGYYLKPDQSGLQKIEKSSSTSLFLNSRLNLELSYLLNNNLRLMLRPTCRMNLSKVLDGDNMSHKYVSTGINIGLVFRLK